MRKIIIIVLCVLISGSTLPAENNHRTPVGLSGKSDIELNIIGLSKLKNSAYLEAEKYFRLAINKAPQKKHYYNNIAVTYMKQGKYDNAYSNLKIAVLLDENYVKALSNLAISCFYLGKFMESYKYYMRVKNIDRDYLDNRFKRERVLKRLDELSEDEKHRDVIRKIQKYLKK